METILGWLILIFIVFLCFCVTIGFFGMACQKIANDHRKSKNQRRMMKEIFQLRKLQRQQIRELKIKYRVDIQELKNKIADEELELRKKYQ
jgi:hypothetical protein